MSKNKTIRKYILNIIFSISFLIYLGFAISGNHLNSLCAICFALGVAISNFFYFDVVRDLEKYEIKEENLDKVIQKELRKSIEKTVDEVLSEMNLNEKR